MKKNIDVSFDLFSFRFDSYSSFYYICLFDFEFNDRRSRGLFRAVYAEGEFFLTLFWIHII